MELIEEYKGVKFYKGIDFEYARDYRGSEMIIFLVDNWAKELIREKRDSVLNSVIYGTFYKNVIEVSNFRVCIYQTDGYINEMISSIKKKMLTEFVGTHNYMAVSGITTKMGSGYVIGK